MQTRRGDRLFDPTAMTWHTYKGGGNEEAKAQDAWITNEGNGSQGTNVCVCVCYVRSEGRVTFPAEHFSG